MDELGPGQKALVRPHYPHMLYEDNHIWTKFLKTDAARIQELWYDVRVGQPVYLGETASEMELKIAGGLTRKRIDVICRVNGDYWVVEVKPWASMLAVGQVITYARLFALGYNVTARVIPVIVCDALDEDLIEQYDELGILVLVNK